MRECDDQEPQKMSERVASGAARRIAFALGCAVVLHGCAATIEADSAVFAVDSNGTELEWIGSPAGAPVWAPDGGSIAWGTEDGLVRRDLADAEATLLTTSSIAGRPAWSPDGSTIAFVDRDRAAMVVLDAAHGDVEASIPIATENAGGDPHALSVLGGPAWSPDGLRLAYICWDGSGDEICVVGADGANQRQVSDIRARRGSEAQADEPYVAAPSNTGPPAWSPDGTALAVAAYPDQRGAATGVYVVDLEQGTARRESALLPNSEIVWFPDGESLLFSATENGRSDVLRVWIGSEEVDNLTENLPGGAREPALATDGTRLALANVGSIVVMNLDGRIEWSNSSRPQNRFPSWSPRGDAIAFTSTPNPLLSFS